MKVTSIEHRRECELQRRSVLATVVRKLKSLANRYPSEAQSLLSISDQAIVSSTSFVSAVIIGRLTTPDQLGLYYLVLSVVLIVVAVQDCVVTAPYLVYSRRREGRELEEYTGSVWIQHLALCAVSISILLAIIAIESITGPPEFLPGLWVLLGATPLILLRQGIRRMAIASLRVRSAIVLDLVVAAAQLGGFALLGFVGALDLARIFAVMGGACGLACVGVYLMDPPTIRFVRRRFVPDWCFNWNFSKWSLRGHVIGSVTPYLVLWTLGLTAGAAAVGVFGACSTLIGMTNVLLSGISNVLTPQAAHAFSTDGPDGMRRMLLRTSMFLLITLAGFSLLIMFTGDWLMVLAFGTIGRGTTASLAMLALSMLISGAGLIAGCGLWAVDEPRTNAIGDMYCLIITVIASALLIPWLAVLGAALATLFGMTAGAVARMIMLQRYLNCAAMDERVTLSDFPIREDAQRESSQTADVTNAGIDLQLTTYPEAVT